MEIVSITRVKRFQVKPEANLKEGIFVGPSILKNMKNTEFETRMSPKEKTAWVDFKNARVAAKQEVLRFHVACAGVKFRPRDCSETIPCQSVASGVREIWPLAGESHKVYCDMETDGGGWTVFQRRGQFNNPQDYFYRNWTDYRRGFGNLEKEFWLGEIIKQLNMRMPGHRKRRQFKQTDAFTRDMVIGLKRAGWSIRQIAADTHLGASTVHRLWRRWLEQGNVAIYRNAGATRVTSARVDRRILRQAVAAPQATCTAFLQHVQDTLDHSISTRTISRRLVANGLHSCRPLRRLPLTPPNRRQRLEWCRARSTWMTEWHRVVFSDESRFCLSSDSRRVRVWRRRGERSNPEAIVERPTVRQRGIMVWGAIAYDSRSPLLRIQGTMTAQRYVDDVLRPVTLPYLQGVPNALYQQDNARPHTARISQQALQDVQMLPWPPYSTDLSPIEHVWDIIGRRLHALPQPRSEDELWQMVEREWRAIPQDAIRTLIDSLPRRVAACIAVRGNEIIYQLTSKDNWELRVDMKAKDGESAFSTYQDFWMSDESDKYRLHLSLYLGGTGGDSLTGHNNLQFTTRDCQNDKNGAGANCALIFKGGWWYNACHSSNLNGLNLNGPHESYADGIEWYTFKQHHNSLVWTEMKIRPINRCGANKETK
ncbi:hypothetical protein LAZ67_3005564 [Cordylochernes scorpioides]|uniref:Fibrinogen C-terminal domain-containing protein n=1 Tax=Cordylochernes scorpioides TaxID=51811 RepID=A0ABY6KDJ7_9ARAC|nr:hypothetical protein LAZ67_3005564 [Cordylochernes scorpioides]